MLSNSITVTIDSQAYTLLRKNQDNFSSVFMDNTTIAGTEVMLKLRSLDEGKPKLTQTSAGQALSQFERHVADLTVTVTDSSGFRKATQSYIHIRHLKGADVADVAAVATGLLSFVGAYADELIAWDV